MDIAKTQLDSTMGNNSESRTHLNKSKCLSLEARHSKANESARKIKSTLKSSIFIPKVPIQSSKFPWISSRNPLCKQTPNNIKSTETKLEITPKSPEVLARSTSNTLERVKFKLKRAIRKSEDKCKLKPTNIEKYRMELQKDFTRNSIQTKIKNMPDEKTRPALRSTSMTEMEAIRDDQIEEILKNMGLEIISNPEEIELVDDISPKTKDINRAEKQNSSNMPKANAKEGATKHEEYSSFEKPLPSSNPINSTNGSLSSSNITPCKPLFSPACDVNKLRYVRPEREAGSDSYYRPHISSEINRHIYSFNESLEEVRKFQTILNPYNNVMDTNICDDLRCIQDSINDFSTFLEKTYMEIELFETEQRKILNILMAKHPPAADLVVKIETPEMPRQILKFQTTELLQCFMESLERPYVIENPAHTMEYPQTSGGINMPSDLHQTLAENNYENSNLGSSLFTGDYASISNENPFKSSPLPQTHHSRPGSENCNESKEDSVIQSVDDTQKISQNVQLNIPNFLYNENRQENILGQTEVTRSSILDPRPNLNIPETRPQNPKLIIPGSKPPNRDLSIPNIFNNEHNHQESLLHSSANPSNLLLTSAEIKIDIRDCMSSSRTEVCPSTSLSESSPVSQCHHSRPDSQISLRTNDEDTDRQIHQTKINWQSKRTRSQEPSEYVEMKMPLIVTNEHNHRNIFDHDFRHNCENSIHTKRDAIIRIIQQPQTNSMANFSGQTGVRPSTHSLDAELGNNANALSSQHNHQYIHAPSIPEYSTMAPNFCGQGEGVPAAHSQDPELANANALATEHIHGLSHPQSSAIAVNSKSSSLRQCLQESPTRKSNLIERPLGPHTRATSVIQYSCKQRRSLKQSAVVERNENLLAIGHISKSPSSSPSPFVSDIGDSLHKKIRNIQNAHMAIVPEKSTSKGKTKKATGKHLRKIYPSKVDFKKPNGNPSLAKVHNQQPNTSISNHSVGGSREYHAPSLVNIKYQEELYSNYPLYQTSSILLYPTEISSHHSVRTNNTSKYSAESHLSHSVIASNYPNTTHTINSPNLFAPQGPTASISPHRLYPPDSQIHSPRHQMEHSFPRYPTSQIREHVLNYPSPASLEQQSMDQREHWNIRTPNMTMHYPLYPNQPITITNNSSSPVIGNPFLTPPQSLDIQTSPLLRSISHDQYSFTDTQVGIPMTPPAEEIVKTHDVLYMQI
ncbi:uncharacterized protein LOC142236452 [Haematobia irritans]|uniref:uncharacterized protein LOC142236452 n=1 Tax=Haematobia irritans TaxID=7368 RepID=UPI003F50675F